MTKRAFVVIACAVALSACTSIRVTGFVTDEKTGDPVGTCGITFGEFYTACDAAGHYAIKGRTSWKAMQVIAPGYQPMSVPVDSSRTRYPAVNIQMTPKKAAKTSARPGPGADDPEPADKPAGAALPH